ncbi:DNA primase [Streptomyces sp. 8K308]|uniref:DNA primase n=1 Tax=Streptomyces sp. 8K308 TaxID=2530388 RepID=UPI0010486A38|nr:DNA primase [Streptomyces sp. 8K308]TDC21245.1 DNA primase [Streptomyces sp. 8K308]
MTHARQPAPPFPLTGDSHLDTALALATAGVPVLPLLPLRGGKAPVGNCLACAKNRCGGRPNMKNPGPCHCPRPCHGWAAATTNPAALTSPQWSAAWRQAAAVAYHPAGADVTVVDLDNPAAVEWARATLPPTRTVATSRGEHWIYRGTTTSANSVRPGVDIKSAMAYARWLGPGIGTMTPLPDAVRALLVREEATRRAGVASSTPQRAAWDHSAATGCRHTERYVHTGLNKGLAMIRARTEQGAGSQAFGVARFLAALHTACPGPCGLDAIASDLIAAAVSVGVPEPYATRAVTNGLDTALNQSATHRRGNAA